MSPTQRTLRLLALSLAMSAGLSTTHAAEVVVPPFYQNLPAISPDKPLGTVVAKEEVATSIPGAQSWRIAYTSSDVLGRNTLSTALVIAPADAPPAGGRPIVAWAHGTTGTAQNCGPSQLLDPAQDLNEYNLVGGTSWTDFGVPAATRFIRDGYVVVATDYQGLGAGGVHQYNNTATQARDIVNSVRAVAGMGLSGGAGKFATYGWSQGGGAVLGVASLPAELARTGTAFDGLSLVGVVSLAPYEVEVLIPPQARTPDAADKVMQGLAEGFLGSIFNFSHYAVTLWTMSETFPDLKFTDIMTDDGARVMTEIFSKKCMHAGADTMNFTFGDGYRALIKPQPDNAAAWVKHLVDSSITSDKPVAPIIIYFGDKDVTNDPVMGKLYQAQRCAQGANVTRVQLPGEQNHFTTPPVSEPLYVPWIEDRFAGKPLDNGCPAN